MTRGLWLVVMLTSVVACSSPLEPTPVRASTEPLIAPGGMATTSSVQVETRPSRVELDGQAQRFTGTIMAAPDVRWTMTAVVPWIAVETPSGQGPSSFTARVESNLCTSDPRVGHLRVAPQNEVVIVWQDGSDIGIC